MNLQPINPPLQDGQKVQCAKCHRMTAQAVANLHEKPGTFYCVPDCVPPDCACTASGDYEDNGDRHNQTCELAPDYDPEIAYDRAHCCYGNGPGGAGCYCKDEKLS